MTDPRLESMPGSSVYEQRGKSGAGIDWGGIAKTVLGVAGPILGGIFGGPVGFAIGNAAASGLGQLLGGTASDAASRRRRINVASQSQGFNAPEFGSLVGGLISRNQVIPSTPFTTDIANQGIWQSAMKRAQEPEKPITELQPRFSTKALNDTLLPTEGNINGMSASGQATGVTTPVPRPYKYGNEGVMLYSEVPNPLYSDAPYSPSLHPQVPLFGGSYGYANNAAPSVAIAPKLAETSRFDVLPSQIAKRITSQGPYKIENDDVVTPLIRNNQNNLLRGNM